MLLNFICRSLIIGYFKNCLLSLLKLVYYCVLGSTFIYYSIIYLDKSHWKISCTKPPMMSVFACLWIFLMVNFLYHPSMLIVYIYVCVPEYLSGELYQFLFWFYHFLNTIFSCFFMVILRMLTQFDIFMVYV